MWLVLIHFKNIKFIYYSKKKKRTFHTIWEHSNDRYAYSLYMHKRKMVTGVLDAANFKLQLWNGRLNYAGFFYLYALKKQVPDSVLIHSLPEI